MKISHEIIINAPIEVVYNTYANISNWNNVMDDVVGVDIFYDDTRHQEFDMTVKRGEITETVHSIRFCNPFSSIEIFQTQPPPMFTKMSGIWLFEKIAEGTLVKAERNFELKEGVDFDENVLSNFLKKNIESFKKWIESKQEVCA